VPRGLSCLCTPALDPGGRRAGAGAHMEQGPGGGGGGGGTRGPMEQAAYDAGLAMDGDLAPHTSTLGGMRPGDIRGNPCFSVFRAQSPVEPEPRVRDLDSVSVGSSGERKRVVSSCGRDDKEGKIVVDLRPRAREAG
jgi:hypothetical protein